MATNDDGQGNLTGYQYVRLGQVISCSSIESIALGYLNINREKIKQLKEARRQDAEGFVIDVIEERESRILCLCQPLPLPNHVSIIFPKLFHGLVCFCCLLRSWPGLLLVVSLQCSHFVFKEGKKIVLSFFINFQKQYGSSSFSKYIH